MSRGILGASRISEVSFALHCLQLGQGLLKLCFEIFGADGVGVLVRVVLEDEGGDVAGHDPGVGGPGGDDVVAQVPQQQGEVVSVGALSGLDEFLKGNLVKNRHRTTQQKTENSLAWRTVGQSPLSAWPC